MQRTETGTHEIHLNRTKAIRRVQNCTWIYNKADRQAKMAVMYDSLCLTQVKLIDRGTSETEDLQELQIARDSSFLALHVKV